MFSKKDPILTVMNLKKYYSTNFGLVRAVDNVSFKLHPGEILGLIGESGSGKTTIANSILRLIPNSTGIVAFEDKIISGRKITKSRHRFLYKNIQMTFQNPFASLDPQKNVFSILSEPLEVNNIINDLYKDLFSDWKEVTKVSKYTFIKEWEKVKYKIRLFHIEKSQDYFSNLKKSLKKIETNIDTLEIEQEIKDLINEFYEERIRVNSKILSYIQYELDQLYNLYFIQQKKFRSKTLSKVELEIFNLEKEKKELELFLRTKKTKKNREELHNYNKGKHLFKNDQKINKYIIQALSDSLKSDAKYEYDYYKKARDINSYFVHYLEFWKFKSINSVLVKSKQNLLNLSAEELFTLVNTTLLKQWQFQMNHIYEKVKISTINPTNSTISLTTQEIKKEVQNIKFDLNLAFASDKKNYDDFLAIIKPKIDNHKTIAKIFLASKKRLGEIEREYKLADEKWRNGRNEFQQKIKIEIEEIIHKNKQLDARIKLLKDKSKSLNIYGKKIINRINKKLKNQISVLISEIKKNKIILKKVSNNIIKNNKEINHLDGNIKLLKSKITNSSANKKVILLKNKRNFESQLHNLKLKTQKIEGEKKVLVKNKYKLENSLNLSQSLLTKFVIDLKHGEVTNKSFDDEIKIYNKKIYRITYLYRIGNVSILKKKFIKTIILYNCVVNALKEVGLKSEHAYRYPHEFSGGQRQRIVIARALISKPKIIIADEPIASLDISIQAQIVNLLISLCKDKGIAMIFIAHDLSMVEYISDNIMIMHLGKLVEYGSKEEIFANPIHPYTKNLFNSIPKISNSHIPFEADNFDLSYLKDYSPFNKPYYQRINHFHFVLSSDEQQYQWGIKKRENTRKNKTKNIYNAKKNPKKSTYYYEINKNGKKIKTFSPPNNIFIPRDKIQHSKKSNLKIKKVV